MRLYGAYVRMLNIIKALEGEFDLGDLDPLARSVLFLVAEKQSNQEDLFVSDVIGQPGFGAAMTVFARLRELERPRAGSRWNVTSKITAASASSSPSPAVRS